MHHRNIDTKILHVSQQLLGFKSPALDTLMNNLPESFYFF